MRITDIHYINLDTKLAVISVIARFFIRRQNKRLLRFIAMDFENANL